MSISTTKHSQRGVRTLVTSLAVLCSLISLSQSAALYDPVKSYVAIYNPKNFDSQVTNNRQKGISIVHFYKDTDGISKGFTGQYELFAKENKGMFRMGSVDCNAFAPLCAKEKVTTFPLFRVYPAFPAPTQDYEEPTLDIEKIKKLAGRFVQSRTVEINSNNLDTFIDELPGKPKVLLFTDKKGTPLIYKALSTHFDKTLLFGIVRDTDAAVVAKYKVKTFPAVFLIKNKDAKPQKYDGTDFTYQAIFDFINIYSETFVFKDTKEEEVKSAASKPWLSEKVPQLNSDSANDICLKKEGALCVIYIVKDEASKKQSDLEALNQISAAFASKISRGINFHFMWLDASQEPDFFGLFKIEDSDLPQVAIMNPGKRKRYLVHKGEISESQISATMDRILGGDGKFVNVKENELPKLVSKYVEAPKQ